MEKKKETEKKKLITIMEFIVLKVLKFDCE